MIWLVIAFCCGAAVGGCAAWLYHEHSDWKR